MELLCCLPKHPIHVSLSKLAKEIGLQSQKEAKALLAQIEDMGVSFRYGFVEGNHTVGITEGWLRAQTIGNAYWETVYGE